MKAADKITFLRIILAPCFFILFLRPGMTGGFFESIWYLISLWIIFLIVELSDLLDGMVARMRKEESDFGKLFDPFADVLVRVTYFLCFIVSGFLPVFPFLIILYREFGILFLRVLMMKKGIAMGARMGGKIKAVTYMLTGFVCLAAFSAGEIGFQSFVPHLNLTGNILFYISMLIAVISFIDYLLQYFKAGKTQ